MRRPRTATEMFRSSASASTTTRPKPKCASTRRCSDGWAPVSTGIPGIGDQALDESGAMMMVRKGDKLIRIMYSTCPCSVEAIKPLAKTLADRV